MSASTHDHDREEGLDFRPKFDATGLVTCVATDVATGDVLMVAHMNDEALRKTIATGEGWYFSRSRNALWRKGESSGQTQRVVEIRMEHVGEPPIMDLDNLAKAILDAIKGYLFHDDAQVARLIVERFEGERERIMVRSFPRR